MELTPGQEHVRIAADSLLAKRLQEEEDFAQTPVETEAPPRSLEMEPPAKRLKHGEGNLLRPMRSTRQNVPYTAATHGSTSTTPLNHAPEPTRASAARISRAARSARPSSFISASQLLQQEEEEDGLPSDFSTGLSDLETEISDVSSDELAIEDDEDEADGNEVDRQVARAVQNRRGFGSRNGRAAQTIRQKLESFHRGLVGLWSSLENEPPIKPLPTEQPASIHRRMKGFQLEGLSWMKQMEASKYKGGILGDEMGLGKTIQAVSLIMSDFPAGKPSLVLVPPVALLQWVSEIDSYTDKRLKTLVYHATNSETKSMKLNELKKYDVIIMSYNSLESMYRRETKGHRRKRKGDNCTEEIHTQPSIIHKIDFHRLILDEAHEIKVRSASSHQRSICR